MLFGWGLWCFTMRSPEIKILKEAARMKWKGKHLEKYLKGVPQATSVMNSLSFICYISLVHIYMIYLHVTVHTK